MAKALLGKKLGMSQIFSENGHMMAVTVIEAGPCTVLQKKTTAKERYAALQLGFDQKPERVTNRPERGHLKASKATPKRFVREVRMTDEEVGGVEVGSEIGAGIFEKGERVNVVGTSKGRGFAGVIKRHHFKGAQTISRGTHEFFRHAGSIGTTATPGRLFMGKRMPGHMGSARVTAKNLQIVDIRPEENLIFVKGAVPGPQNGYVIVKAIANKS
jgi:large subunit ribosomal protein L3